MHQQIPHTGEVAFNNGLEVQVDREATHNTADPGAKLLDGELFAVTIQVDDH